MIHRIVLFLKFAPVFGRLLIVPLWNRKNNKTSVDGQTSQKSVDLNALKEPNFYYRRFEPEGSRLPRLRSGLFRFVHKRQFYETPTLCGYQDSYSPQTEPNNLAYPGISGRLSLQCPLVRLPIYCILS